MTYKLLFPALFLLLMGGLGHAASEQQKVEDYSATINKFKQAPAAASFFESVFNTDAALRAEAHNQLSENIARDFVEASFSD